MRLARFGSILLLTMAAWPALDLVFSNNMFARAQETAQDTRQNYEALKRMLEARDPGLAEKLDRELKKIDGEEGTFEQKAEAKARYIRKQIDQANETRDAAIALGGASETAAEVVSILRGIAHNHSSGFINASALFPLLESEFLRRIASLKIAAQLEEERKRAAETKGQDGGIAPEHSRANGGKPEISVALGGGIGEREVPRQRYLATEFGGLLTIGVMGQDRDVTETSWDVALRYAGEFSGFRVADGYSHRSDAGNFFNTGNLSHELKFGGSHGSSSESLDDFDPGAGVGLGIPGTGDGMFPAGIFLLDLPGFSNDVIGSWGRYEVDSFEAGYRGGYEFDVGAGFSLQPFVGLGYRHTSEKQSFGGSIEGYGIDFEYDTRLRLDAFKTEIGARLEHQLSDTLSIFGEPSVSLNFIDLDGWDGLELSGGGADDSQRVDLDRNEIQPGVKLAVGFDWEPVASPFSVYAGAVIAHEPTTATVYRSGEVGEESKADVKYSTSYGVNLSLWYKF